MTRPEWIESRRSYLGGTDIAAIAGKHKYKTPLAVYADKVMGITSESSITAEMGLALEPVCKRYFGIDWKCDILPGELVMHPGLPIGGNIDCFVGTHELPGEIKTTGFSVRPEWGEEMTDEIPPAYHIQGTVYCGLLGAERTLFQRFMRDDGSRAYYEVYRNDNLYGSLLTLAKRFWDENVLARVEPPASSVEDYRVVTYLHPSASGESVTATPEVEALAERYVHLLEVIGPATDEREIIRAQVCQFIGENSAVICEAGTFTFNEEKKGRVLRFRRR